MELAIEYTPFCAFVLQAVFTWLFDVPVCDGSSWPRASAAGVRDEDLEVCGEG